MAKKRTSSDEQRTVEADRRRKQTSQGQRERAEAPQREQRPSSGGTTSGGGSGYSSGGGFVPPSGGGGYTPSGGSSGGFPVGGSGGGFSPMLLLLGGGLLLLLCVGGMLLFGGNLLGGADSSGNDALSGMFGGVEESQTGTFGSVPTVQPGQGAAQQLPSQSSGSSSSYTPPKVGEGDETWLVMLYQDADDKILEEDIFVDLNEAERIGSSDNVHVVAQMDRYRAGYAGDGNWTSTKRFYLDYDPDLNSVRSQELMDLGEVNMASGASLVDFVTWAVAQYPSDKYALILSDHGMGWPGGWTDASSTGRGEDNVALANSTGDMIFLNELDRSLQQIRSTTGIDKFELVGLDACLMAHVEVFGMLSEHAKYAVASQEVEPAVGWAYTGFLGQLLSDPDVSGSDLGQYIVQTYINDDQRITDDQARAAWVGRGGFGVPTIAQLTKQLGDDITLTAVDLQKMPEVMNALNTLAYQMQGDNQRGIAQARNYAQSFTSVFGRQVPPSYLDLGNLAQLIQRNSGNQQVSQAVDALLASLNDAIITERHGQKKPGATGMSVYFPNSDLYRNRVAGAQSYAEVASSFVENSLWDEFLAYHYTGRQFGPAEQLAAVPAAVDVAAPGKGDISISNLNISADSVDIGETVRITADISGDNIGYIKLFVGYLDERANSLNIIDSDYLESGETREVGGVYYPDWGEGDFELAFEWEPIVFAIDDGSQRALALFEPEAYGASVDDAVYSVDGVYTYDDGTTYRARMYFNNSDGTMRDVYGFAGDGTNGTPREITPSPGDTFTVLEQWLDQQPAGQPAVAATEPGSTVEMARQQLVWRDLDAPAGTFVLGFLVEDLDGNVYPAYGEIVVN